MQKHSLSLTFPSSVASSSDFKMPAEWLQITPPGPKACCVTLEGVKPPAPAQNPFCCFVPVVKYL